MIRTVLLCVAMVLIAGAVITGRARGHDIYSDWKMPDQPGMSCCHSKDCRPVRAQSDLEGRWTAMVDGERILVPQNKLMRQPSPDGRSHWCGRNGVTYCFAPGEVRG